MFDEDAEAFFDRLVNMGPFENPQGVRIQYHRTIYGIHSFMFHPERMRELLGDFITDFLFKVTYGHTVEEAINKAAPKIDLETIEEITVNLGKEMKDEYKQWTEHAMELLSKQLSETLERTIEEHIEVTIIRALLDRSGKGFYKFNVEDKEVIKTAVRDHLKTFKEQIGARKRGGSEGWWKPERLEKFLTLYETSLEMMQVAKNIYKNFSSNEKWQEMVIGAYPELTDDFIDRLPESGKDAEPGVLARDFSAMKMNIKPGKYLEKILIKARRARRSKADTES